MQVSYANNITKSPLFSLSLKNCCSLYKAIAVHKRILGKNKKELY